jgi:four helix bundle protein
MRARLRSFALRIIDLCGELPNTPAGRAIASQLVRAGTSPGTNYRAACRGRSRADFIAKLAIADEEMDESNYWLDLVIAGGLLPAARVLPLYKESDELARILAASRLTAALNASRERCAPRSPNQKSKIKIQKSA